MKNSSYGVSPSILEHISQKLEYYHEDAIPPDYWHGYFTALATSPVLIPESTWEDLIFNKKEVNEAIKNEIRDTLTGITQQLYTKSFNPYFPGKGNTWKECSPSAWCDGFLTASHLWPEDIQKKAGEELVMLVMPILIFHDPNNYQKNTSKIYSDKEWEEFLESNFIFLKQGIFELLELWQELLEQ